ncbi:MAG TPA: MFS transporter [Baekduia sp.]|jgi:MFS family permease|nr:MFS transporter [Baekduia sp.]
MRSRLPLLVLLCTAQFVDVLDVNAVLVALPLIGRDLGLSGGLLQWVVTAYVLVFAGCLLVAGRLADTYGRRRVFGAGLALFTAGSLACGLAPTAGTLVLARAAQGLGAALTAPAALAMIVDAFPAGPRRERAVAVWTGVAAVGGACGLVLGGVIAGGLGWRWVFLVNVPVGVAALALTPRLLDESRSPHGPRALDLPGALAATGGLGLLVLALAQAEQSGPLTPVPLAALAGATLLLAGLAVRERTAAQPLVPPTLLGNRQLRAALLAAAVLTATTSGGGVLATLHLQDVLGLGPLSAGLVLLPLSVSVVAGSVVAARLAAPPPAVIAGGLALVGAGAVSAAAGLTAVSGGASLVVWGVLTGLGLGSASVAATTLGTSAVDDADRGTVAGLLNTAAQVGTALGVASLVLVAATTSATAGHRIGFAAAAALALVAAVAQAMPLRARAPARTQGGR